MLRILIIILWINTGYIGVVPLQAQTDTVFWFAAPEISMHNAGLLDRPVYLRVTSNIQPATVRIFQPAGGGLPLQTLTLAANSTQSIDLTPWIDFIENKPANTVLNYGIKIESSAPVTVYYDVVSGGTTGPLNPEAFILKGTNALGTDFRIPSQNLFNNATSYTPTPSSSFDIVATENNTNVTITPSNDIFGHTAGTTFTITLNEGETYSATATSGLAARHLGGSRVVSDKPVAITVKDDLLATSVCADLAGDQIVPIRLLGTEYVAVNGLLTGSGDQLFITATQNGTTIAQNGGVPVATINAGDTYQLPVSVGGAASTYVQTSHPVYVWQVSGMGCEVGAGLLPRINCTGSSSVSYVRSTNANLYFNIVLQSGGQGDFMVNGVAGVITAAQFTAVTGTGGQWMAAQVSLPLSSYPQGSVIAVSNTSSLFHLGVLEGSDGFGTGYGYFSNFNAAVARARASSSSVCSGDDIFLYADTVSGAVTYTWTGPGNYTSNQQNPVVPNVSVLGPGSYILTVDIAGCGSDSDTVIVYVHDLPVVNLGPDTALCADSLILSSSVSYTSPSYLWSSGRTTPTLTVDQPGVYRLQVTDQGCTGTDSIDVVLDAALTVDLGNDTGICDRDIPLTLSSPQPAGTQYLWSTGLTTPSIDVTRTDRYWVEVTLGDCKGSDTINVDVIPTPAIHIGNDSFICEGQPVYMGDVIPGATYLWNTGSSTPFISVSESGIYVLTADLSGCKVSDTVQITVMPLPAPDLGPDDDMCPEQVIVLDAAYPGGRYEWNTGDTTSSLQVDNPGTYYVQVMSEYGCTGSDTVTFTHYPLPVVLLAHDTTVCEEQPLMLQAFSEHSDSLLWSDGSVGAALTVRQGGLYIATGINKCGMGSDTILVKQIFCDIWVPNAFTPNGDGLNDVFRVLGNVGRLERFGFGVFNRWGEQVFYTTDKYAGWDGKHKGTKAPLGVYVYMLEYSIAGEPVLQKGNLTLLR